MLHRINLLQKKNLCIMLIVFIIANLIFTINISKVNADSYRYTYDGGNLDTTIYPGYKNLIDTLKSKHSNWKFTIMETGLDFEQVILAETGNKSLIQGKTGSWVNGSYDSSWRIASSSAVRYYIDPRNWIVDNYNVFQFMALGTYIDVTDSELNNALKGTYLYQDDCSIASQINSASKINSMNPFYVVARILQEQGSGTKPSSTFAMTDGGTTYYNIFNIGASGKGSAEVIANALSTAKEKRWTSISSCISGGINTLKTYINRKQDTLYLNKFDVESYNGLYAYQYMQNIMAPTTESKKMYDLMEKANLLDKNITFVIPVYTGMKATKYLSPDTVGDLGPQDIRIKDGHNNINIRSSASKSAGSKAKVNEGFTMLSIKRESNGWHEVMYNNGNGYEIGYIYFDQSYLEQIADQTNCNENMIIGDENVTLYSGPGNEEMKVLTTGQIVTRIDNSGKYNIDEAIWDRISLADGTQGFVKRDSLLNSSDVQLMYVNTESDPLIIRDAPNGNKIRKIAKGTQVTRISAASDMVAGHYWDEIVTPDGATGYAAREYLAPVNEENGNNQNNSFKEETIGNIVSLKIEPNTTLENLKSQYGESISIVSNNITKKEEGALGTGDKLVVGDKTYTIIKIGDVNGDGVIKATDYVKIRNYIMQAGDLTDEQKAAADVTNDGKIKATDYVKIRNYIMGTGNINI